MVLQLQDKVSETFWSRFKFKSLFTTMGILKLYPICFCAVDYRQIHNTCRCDEDDDVNVLSVLQALLQCRSCIPVSVSIFASALWLPMQSHNFWVTVEPQREKKIYNACLQILGVAFSNDKYAVCRIRFFFFFCLLQVDLEGYVKDWMTKISNRQAGPKPMYFS